MLALDGDRRDGREPSRGTAIDKRADIWAYGAVLYELLTGERAFSGGTASDTLASVLKTGF